MKKELNELIEKYVAKTEYPRAVYFSEQVPDARYKGYKYFFKFIGTHNVSQAFKTQREIEEFINIELTELKVFKDYNDLKESIGATGQLGTYADTELSDFLDCVGSNENCNFELTIEGKEYSISVTSNEIDEDTFDYEYTLFEISSN